MHDPADGHEIEPLPQLPLGESRAPSEFLAGGRAGGGECLEGPRTVAGVDAEHNPRTIEPTDELGGESDRVVGHAMVALDRRGFGEHGVGHVATMREDGPENIVDMS